MPLKTITFPHLLLAPRQGGMELSLQTSVTLNLPESLSNMHSYSGLVHAVRDEQLWIARNGISHFTVELTNDGFQISELDRVMVTDWVERHEIWGRLGVRLVSSGYMPGMIQFSIQHPDLSSFLAAPAEALTAEFREVRCRIDVQAHVEGKPSAKGKKRRKTQHAKQEPQFDHLKRFSNENSGPIETDVYELLDPADQIWIDEFLSGPVPPVSRNKRHRGAADSASVDSIQYSRSLLEGAVEIALFGGSKRVNGVKVLEGADTQGLTQLLPGVFHMPHLKVISERASLLPVIATSLARMTNAESPSLRRQTNDFKYGLPSLDMEVSESEKIMRGIEKATWCTLLKNVKTPALKPKSSRQSARQTPQPLPMPVNSSSERGRRPTLVLGEMFASQGSSGSQYSTLERWGPRRHPGTPTGEVKREPELSFSKPMGTSQTSSQERGGSGFWAFHDSPPTVNTTPGMASPFSTPLPNDHVYSTYNSLNDFQGPGSPESWGVCTQTSTAYSQQHSPSGFFSSAEYYPSTSQDQNFYPLASQDQISYHMGSQDTMMGLDTMQDTMSMMDPTNFGDLLGDASMTNWDVGS